VSGTGTAYRRGSPEHERIRLRVDGTVQGVGFRPFVYRLAGELQLGGWVRNDGRGVELEIEGPCEAVRAFAERLTAEAPPMARVERVRSEPQPLRGERRFWIASSTRDGRADALVAPDAATCGQCLTELRDPGDRRYRYPFINCTNCGPRFTIVRGVPYDRPRTTMRSFQMCAACQSEFEDPRDRRFHAQPNACPQCGPEARLLRAGEASEGAAALTREDDAVAAAAALLREGAIVAVKGLGGYHLACLACDEAAVGALRARKRREERPFALMAADRAAARGLAEISEAEDLLLSSPARPIVLLERRARARVADAVAPGLRELGVMLPYTPIHHLLLGDLALAGAGALVMTSGNVSDEPIAHTDEEARERLAGIADGFLVHDRPIHMRLDDSVARVVELRSPARERRTSAAPAMLRRSRGYVPATLGLPLAAPKAVLACGAELKSTFCLARGARAWVSHHIGDLRNWETLCSFREGIAHFEELFSLTPELVVHDLHPDYLSSSYALERDGVELLAVQHHHAHLAAVLAEYDEQGPAVGAIFDGAGLGLDGTVWGGELLLGGLDGFERAGHLREVRLPGGDMAAREPWRMACAWLAQALDQDEPAIPATLRGQVPEERWAAVARLSRGNIAAPMTSSVGRLYDAVAALCGLRATVSYEGQAAIELEAVADPVESMRYQLVWRDGEIDPGPAMCQALSELDAGLPVGNVSTRFHRGLAAATVQACSELAEGAGVSIVVLAGGVFQNRLLLRGVHDGLCELGVRVLVPARLPTNDAAISFGQAAIAAARSAL
jgi:hydrogenase maturation protein HypF